MPELPEVETVRLVLDRALKGRKLVDVRPKLDDSIMFDQASPEEVRRALLGANVTGTGRKGKYLWLKLDRRPWPVIHFGMTGKVEVIAPRLADFGPVWEGVSLIPPVEASLSRTGGATGWGNMPKGGATARTEEPEIPRFCRMLLVADDGARVAVIDARRFRRIRLAKDPLTQSPISDLGYDPLTGPFPSAPELQALLTRRRAPIKAVLLDQALFAGVGNWIADEVLFQARLSPKRLASKLSPGEVTRLRAKLLDIIRKSVAYRADYERYPRSWLFHYRWGRKEGALAHGQRRIRHDQIGGRTTAWVPELQK